MKKVAKKKSASVKDILNRAAKINTGNQFYPCNFNAFGVNSAGKIQHSYNFNWYGCRESFLNSLPRTGRRTFMFSHRPGASKNIADFISEFEDKLKLGERSRIQIIPAEGHNNISHVFIPTWWNSMLRRQLLTILLRAGNNYKQPGYGTFRAALLSEKYARETLPAISLFIDGYRKLKPHAKSYLTKRKMSAYNGWKNFFGHINDKNLLKNILTK